MVILVTNFLFYSVSIYTIENKEIIYISNIELATLLENSDKQYIYLNKEYSNLYEVISLIAELDPDKNSILHNLRTFIDDGFCIGPHDFIKDVLKYATEILEQSSHKIAYEKIENISHSLDLLIKEINNEALTLNSKNIIDYLTPEEILINSSDSITRCP